jgi:hypothetical protein
LDPKLREIIQKRTMGRNSIGNSNKIDTSRKTPVTPSSVDSKESHLKQTFQNR